MTGEQKNPNQSEKVKATTHKPSFFGDIFKDAIDNYIVPRTMATLHDTFSGMVNALSDGAQASIDNSFKKIGWNGIIKPTSSGGTNYNKIYTTTTSANGTIISNNTANRSSTSVQEIYLDTPQAASDLVAKLQGLIAQYKKAKVSDLYGLLDPPITSNFNDFYYGWTDPSAIGYKRVSFGPYAGKYQLVLPTPKDVRNI